MPKFINELSGAELRGKRVLLRLDLNVPIKDGAVLDDFRVKSSMPTLNYLKNVGARIIILSHIGEEGTETLEPVAKYLGVKLLSIRIDNSLKDEVSKISDGEVVMLENLRRDRREVADDPDFAKELASLGDIYVNDAFAVSHRRHASIVSLPTLLPSFGGFLLKSEVENLSKAFNPGHPFLFILGGVKFETKINLVKKFIPLADKIFIGGALTNTIFKKMGYEVGVSVVDQKEIDLGFLLSDQGGIAAGGKIIVPSDVTVLSGGKKINKKPDEVLRDENILDIGEESLETLKKLVGRAKFILWNGPMGNFERGFKNMTEELARSIYESGAKTIIGGGDTLAAIHEVILRTDVRRITSNIFFSTGGGAMLDFLVSGTLPGIEALKV